MLGVWADRCHASDEVRNLVGDWRGGDTKSSSRMADRYSFARCERHVEIRSELLTIAHKAIEKTLFETKDENPDWETVFENWPRGVAGRLLCSSSFPAAPMFEELKDAETSSALKPGSETQSSSSSASDTSDAETHEENSFSFAPWHLASYKGGQLHVAHDEITLCERHLKNPDIGIGFEAAKATGATWSPRCFARLTDGQRNAWMNDNFE